MSAGELMQDGESGLGRWLASRMDARELAREAAAKAAAERGLNLAPHQLRVMAEEQLLTEDITKLSGFLASAASAQLPLVEVHLMSRQLHAMQCYRTILLQRLSLWVPK